MPSVLDPGQDARLDRRTGSPEGLARRVAELERRVARYERGLYVPSFVAPFSGPLSGSGPPSSTSGLQYTIPMTGRYLCFTVGTAWVTVAGWMEAQQYINGTAVGVNLQMYANETGSHKAWPPRLFYWDFTTEGTNYHWLQQNGGTTTDTNDRFTFAGVRVGALP